MTANALVSSNGSANDHVLHQPAFESGVRTPGCQRSAYLRAAVGDVGWRYADPYPADVGFVRHVA